MSGAITPTANTTCIGKRQVEPPPPLINHLNLSKNHAILSPDQITKNHDMNANPEGRNRVVKLVQQFYDNRRNDALIN